MGLQRSLPHRPRGFSADHSTRRLFILFALCFSYPSRGSPLLCQRRRPSAQPLPAALPAFGFGR